ncbi:MAG: hypothetical protein LJE69_13055 [Thiohalocapsa sp.]|jgi:hypothetical protein|uniref:hypothetical protein n=1 Tax=Thiohalocapsa sp. TaxID=2497641 RepID=UPI0025FB321B|nr:hypothetical protein [Thiohalocapsa sp.]MCG6942166.1 hypothetical protein [Thiohalocapsa sp.]
MTEQDILNRLDLAVAGLAQIDRLPEEWDFHADQVLLNEVLRHLVRDQLVQIEQPYDPDDPAQVLVDEYGDIIDRAQATSEFKQATDRFFDLWWRQA